MLGILDFKLQTVAVIFRGISNVRLQTWYFGRCSVSGYYGRCSISGYFRVFWTLFDYFGR